MKTIHQSKIILIVVTSIVLSSQFTYTQVQPKFTFKHEDVDGYIKGLAFSHDNTKLLTTGGQFAMMWNLKTGEKIMTFPPYSGFSAIDFSMDDKKIVTSHVFHAHVAIWDALTGKEIKTITGEIDLTPPSMYTAVAFTLDGEKVLCGNTDGGLFVIDINQGKVIQKFKMLGGYVDNIQIFPDGKRVLASLSIVSLENGKILKEIDKSWPVLSNDGKEIYSYIYSSNNGVEQYIPVIINTDNYDITHQSTPFTYSKMLSTSPDGKMVAVVGQNGKESPHIIDVVASKDVRTFSVDKMPDITFDLVKFSRDGKMIVYVKGDTAYLYDISDLTSSIPGAQEQK